MNRGLYWQDIELTGENVAENELVETAANAIIKMSERIADLTLEKANLEIELIKLKDKYENN
jgi:hypothetical protein